MGVIIKVNGGFGGHGFHPVERNILNDGGGHACFRKRGIDTSPPMACGNLTRKGGRQEWWNWSAIRKKTLTSTKLRA